MSLKTCDRLTFIRIIKNLSDLGSMPPTHNVTALSSVYARYGAQNIVNRLWRVVEYGR